VSWPETAGGRSQAAVAATLGTAKARVARLAKTIETEVIPRLVEHLRDPAGPALVQPAESDVRALVQHLLEDDSSGIDELLHALQAGGIDVGTLYAELLAPAARRLGEMWEFDRVDFAAVTVGLGRLQRLLRKLSPAFGSEVEHPAHGRRIVLTQPDSEQHIFGLAMVAEFFRRDGWDVLGGVAGVGLDAAAWVRRDWFDVVGFSIGSELSLPWLRNTVAEVRRLSRNPSIVVMVGGPLFTLNPGWVAEVGADATADGRSAPQIAENLLVRHSQERSGRARPS
jgi:methanogenic corrinoid protein MtbC1